MRTNLISLFLLALTAAPTAAHANTITDGPLTFGSNLPFEAGPNLVPIGGQYYVAPLTGAGLYLNSIGTPNAWSSQTIAFTFDLAPGWTITSMALIDSSDFGFLGENTKNPTPYSNWGYEYAQQVTLCTTSNACSTASYGQHLGGAPMPPISFNAQAGPGTGVYQTYDYTQNANFRSVNPTGFNIFLTQTAVAPEPSSFILFGTGALGLLGALKRRLTSR